MVNTLILTVGLPRSGKSFWSRQTGLPTVNPDSIRLALHGQEFCPSAEPMVWAVARLMVKSLFLAGHPVVILDATNLTPRRRDEWLSKDWTCEYVGFTTPMEVCLERAHATGKPNLCPVIRRMAKDQEWPMVAHVINPAFMGRIDSLNRYPRFWPTPGMPVA